MRPAIEGRRAARDFARLHGPPYTPYENAQVAANDLGVREWAGKHTRKSNTTTRKLPRNWRGRLPMPLIWYGLNVPEMVIINGTGAAPCPMHLDKGRSLIVNLSASRGTWACVACGHGDMVGFVMRRFGKSFVDAVRHLVGVRQW